MGMEPEDVRVIRGRTVASTGELPINRREGTVRPWVVAVTLRLEPTYSGCGGASMATIRTVATSGGSASVPRMRMIAKLAMATSNAIRGSTASMRARATLGLGAVLTAVILSSETTSVAT